VSLRKEFVALASQPQANITELCRRFGIAAKTGYKWLNRFREGGEAALLDQSRRPKSCPTRTAPAVEQTIVQLRQRHPQWGARKLLRRMRDLGHSDLPAPSTGQAILKRRGCIGVEDSQGHRAFIRFEHERPNALWQMDFKGHFELLDGLRCHPLTVLDDHSRFNLGLRACPNEQGTMVREQLIALFRRFGLPDVIAVDNGPPWGDGYGRFHTPLTAWMMCYDIRVVHSRPYHPQTLGKDERFHRTLKTELLRREPLADLRQAQRRFDAWREIYNFERPHHALNGDTPASRYRASERSFPQSAAAFEYPPDYQVRKVDRKGHLSFAGHSVHLSKAFSGYSIGLLPTLEDGVWKIYFRHYEIARIDLRAPGCLT
jgi:transposase InsO family protein